MLTFSGALVKLLVRPGIINAGEGMVLGWTWLARSQNYQQPAGNFGLYSIRNSWADDWSGFPDLFFQ